MKLGGISYQLNFFFFLFRVFFSRSEDINEKPIVKKKRIMHKDNLMKIEKKIGKTQPENISSYDEKKSRNEIM